MARKAHGPSHALSAYEQSGTRGGLQRRARSPRRWWLIGAAAVVAAALIVGVFASVIPSSTPTLSASSTSQGTSASALLKVGDMSTRSIVWRSGGEQTTGTTLTMRWPRTTRINRIVWTAPKAPTIRTGLVRFSDGSTLLLTAGKEGDVDVSFPARMVSDAVITVTGVIAGSSTVALTSLSLGSGGDVRAVVGGDVAASARVTASSSGAASPAVLTNAAARLGSASSGNSWLSAVGDRRPWVELRWATPIPVTSVQLYGPEDASAGPTSGALQFSDGSNVPIGAVRGGTREPTTVGFAPRIVTSVRLQLPAGEVGLSQFAAFEPGSTPPEPAATGTADITPAVAGSCRSTPAPKPASGSLQLLCPSVGTTVRGVAEIAVAMPASQDYTASAWVPLPGAIGQGEIQTVAHGRSSAAGLAKISFDTTRLLKGPINLEVRALGVTPALWVQLVNTSGASVASTSKAVAGRTMLFQDEFNGSVSASVVGANNRYSTTKPTYQGPAEFGSAMFADPAWKSGNLGTIPGGYLRMRLSPANGRIDPFGYGRQQIGAIISSAAVGGGGLSAQYGFFESRILGAPGIGTWPAFWMLSNATLADPKAASGEVDAVELYGHETAKSCHSVHSYTVKQSQVECLQPPQLGDWAIQWHTYGADITPNGTDFYIDGKLVTHEAGPTNASSPYFFLLDLASGGGWPVNLSATRNTADMYVDWVRVYS